MFLTETDLINMKISADAAMNTSRILSRLIQDDALSPKKRLMSEGEQYYTCEHDILQKDFRKSIIYETDEATGGEIAVPFVNNNRSNMRTVSPFHKILVDQKTAYMAGKEPSITVQGGDDKYSAIITNFCNDRFNDIIQGLITGASNKGVEALHVYVDSAGGFKYCIVPASELIPIYDTEYQQELTQLIRYYSITVTKNGRKYSRRRVEWWSKTDVTYYMESENGAYELDHSVKVNPSPHFWSVSLDNADRTGEAHSWGRIPFILLNNNSRSTTDLQPIKRLIDAYDIISSEGSNNLIDLVDLYWAISGYGGEAARAIVKKLKINHAVNISGADAGNIEAKQVDLPVAGRLEWLKMLRRDIYQFGMGIDVDADKFGNAPSGVSLKFQYGLLDMKANAMAAKVRGAIKELLAYYTDYYNRKFGANYDSELISVSLNYSAVANDVETTGIITASEGLLSRKTLLAKHPFVDDVNAELEAAEAERNERMRRIEAEARAYGDAYAE